MSMPQVVHPWSQPSAPMLQALPFSSDRDQAPVALALFNAGFVAAAIAVAECCGDPDLMAQANGWRETQATDAALSGIISAAGAPLIPSVSIRNDGTPRFVLRIPDAVAAAGAMASEHGAHGADAELRLFLDEALRDGDRFVDAAPGVGFVALSAASGSASVSVIALCDDAVQRTAFETSAQWSNVAANLVCRTQTTIGELSLTPATPGGSTIVHAGSAASVAPMLSAVLPALERREIGAVAWRCGTADETGRDAESLQVAAAVLGVFGFQHFALAHGVDGTELVPAEAMASNEMIFSLNMAFQERFTS